MSKTIALSLGLSILGLTLTSSSCSGRKERISYKVERGVLSATVFAGLKRAARATNEAMSALYLRPYDRHQEGFSAVFLGDTAEGNEVRVVLKKVTALTTRVTIRVVNSRNRKLVERILAEIKERL